MFVCFPVYLFACICLFICVCLSVVLSVCLSISQFVFLSTCLCVFWFTFPVTHAWMYAGLPSCCLPVTSFLSLQLQPGQWHRHGDGEWHVRRWPMAPSQGRQVSLTLHDESCQIHSLENPIEAKFRINIMINLFRKTHTAVYDCVMFGLTTERKKRALIINDQA